MKVWTERYAPKSLRDLVIDKKTINLLRSFVENFKNQRKKAALIYGPTGSGKTCSVHTLASDLGYEILEINASDTRNKDSINEIVGNSIKQHSLFNKGKIILIDEIDGLSGMQDRGGVQVLTKLLEESSWPIILTANDPWSSKLKSLKSKSLLIEFKDLRIKDTYKILKKICVEEGIKIDKELLLEIAENSMGDLRAAINDLQTIAEGKKEVKKEDILLYGRKRKESVFKVLNKIFKSKDLNLLDVFDDAGINLDEGLLWLDENLPLVYKGEELKAAYEKLSRADVFRGRILRWQYWRFLVYQNTLMTAGVSVSKDDVDNTFTNYKRTSRILKLWRAKIKYQKRRDIAEKISKHTHCSVKKVIKDMPYIKHALVKEGVAEELDLTPDEMNWLRG